MTIEVDQQMKNFLKQRLEWQQVCILYEIF